MEASVELCECGAIVASGSDDYREDFILCDTRKAHPLTDNQETRMLTRNLEPDRVLVKLRSKARVS
jgi:hypothetical protein